jgi:hypothetical protein
MKEAGKINVVEELDAAGDLGGGIRAGNIFTKVFISHFSTLLIN